MQSAKALADENSTLLISPCQSKRFSFMEEAQNYRQNIWRARATDRHGSSGCEQSCRQALAIQPLCRSLKCWFLPCFRRAHKGAVRQSDCGGTAGTCQTFPSPKAPHKVNLHEFVGGPYSTALCARYSGADFFHGAFRWQAISLGMWPQLMLFWRIIRSLLPVLRRSLA
jgi:hypothetical protein